MHTRKLIDGLCTFLGGRIVTQCDMIKIEHANCQLVLLLHPRNGINSSTQFAALNQMNINIMRRILVLALVAIPSAGFVLSSSKHQAGYLWALCIFLELATSVLCIDSVDLLCVFLFCNTAMTLSLKRTLRTLALEKSFNGEIKEGKRAKYNLSGLAFVFWYSTVVSGRSLDLLQNNWYSLSTDSLAAYRANQQA